MLAQVHGAVCEKDGWQLFQDVTLDGKWTGWSGFRDTFDEHHAHQVVIFSSSPARVKGLLALGRLVSGEARQLHEHHAFWVRPL